MEKKGGGFQRRTMLVTNKTLWFQKICNIILSITETTLRRNFQNEKAERGVKTVVEAGASDPWHVDLKKKSPLNFSIV